MEKDVAVIYANLNNMENYPANLALAVRNFIVLVTDKLEPGDLETFRRFMAVVLELERIFQLVD